MSTSTSKPAIVAGSPIDRARGYGVLSRATGLAVSVWQAFGIDPLTKPSRALAEIRERVGEKAYDAAMSAGSMLEIGTAMIRTLRGFGGRVSQARAEGAARRRAAAEQLTDPDELIGSEFAEDDHEPPPARASKAPVRTAPAYSDAVRMISKMTGRPLAEVAAQHAKTRAKGAS